MRPSHRIYLAFGLDTLRVVMGYLGDLCDTADLFGSAVSPCFTLSPAERAEVAGKLLEVGRLAERGAPETRGLLRAVLGYLFARFLCGSCRTEPVEEGKPEWLDRVCRQMRRPSNFVEGLPALRRLAHKNARYLASVFQDYLGMTPTEFVNDLRLEHAADLLERGDGKIIGVADRCGFSNLSHFYHLFKRRYGIPPGEYRRRTEPLEAGSS
ncbi:MAG: helix-turn-helix transcriptional regulator [Candidatus Brocadiia bacterium]